MHYGLLLHLVPGHGQQDHLFLDFVRTLEAALRTHYAHPSSLRRALKHATPEARRRSGFDGNFSYTILEVVDERPHPEA
jgi:hypothetical protein